MEKYTTFERTVKNVNDKIYYTKVDNRLIKDPRLSFTEVGLMSWMLSQSDEFNIVKDYVEKNSHCTQSVFSKAWKNLVKLGYIEKIRNRNANGTYANVFWKIHEFCPSEPNESKLEILVAESDNISQVEHEPGITEYELTPDSFTANHNAEIHTMDNHAMENQSMDNRSMDNHSMANHSAETDLLLSIQTNNDQYNNDQYNNDQSNNDQENNDQLNNSTNGVLSNPDLTSLASPSVENIDDGLTPTFYSEDEPYTPTLRSDIPPIRIEQFQEDLLFELQPFINEESVIEACTLYSYLVWMNIDFLKHSPAGSWKMNHKDYEKLSSFVSNMAVHNFDHTLEIADTIFMKAKNSRMIYVSVAYLCANQKDVM